MRRYSPSIFLILIPAAALTVVLLCEMLLALMAGWSGGRLFSPLFPFIFNALLIAPLMFWLFALSNRLVFSIGWGSVPPMLIALAHAFKLRILGEVLFVSDFFPSVVGALFRVLPGLGASFLWGVFAGCGVAAAMVFLLTRSRRIRFGEASPPARIAAAMLLSLPAALVLFLSGETGVRLDNALSLKYNVYNRHRNYQRLGLPSALFLGLRDMVRVRRPENYSRDAVNKLLKDNHAAAKPHGQKTDIILVLAETFWDPLKFPRLGVRPDPIPFFRSMLRGGFGGELVVPTLGGGTVKTEFEVLTGLSSRFVDGYPYSTAVRRPVPSLASTLRSRGYRTVAIHGFYGWFYNRNRAMPLLGFDRFIHRGHMLTDNSLGSAEPMRRFDERLYIPDEFILSVARKQARLHSPSFVYVSTYGTHGPFAPTSRAGAPRFETAANIRGLAREKLIGNLILLRRADNAFRKLIQHYRAVGRHRKRRVLVVVFGDHLPARVYLPLDLLNMGGGARHRMFRVPYFVWSNYPRAKGRKLPSLMSSNYLAPLILREAGQSPPRRFRFMERLYGRVPVFSILKKTRDGNWSDQLPDVAASREYLRHYRLLQYDLLYGERFAVGLDEHRVGP